MNSSSPRYGEKASYYSAVCLETGEVEWMDLEGNSNSGTSAAFLDQLRCRGTLGPLQVEFGDNAPAHRGEAVRGAICGAPGLGLRLVNLPGWTAQTSTPMKPSGDGLREEATGNLCNGKQSGGAGEGGQLAWHSADQPERRLSSSR